jgi:hypothetical protein
MASENLGRDTVPLSRATLLYVKRSLHSFGDLVNGVIAQCQRFTLLHAVGADHVGIGVTGFSLRERGQFGLRTVVDRVVGYQHVGAGFGCDVLETLRGTAVGLEPEFVGSIGRDVQGGRSEPVERSATNRPCCGDAGSSAA